MTQSYQDLSMLVQDETAFLRDQLAHCSKLLKCSLKANRPFDRDVRAKVGALLDRLEDSLEARDRQTNTEKERIVRVTHQASELQDLIEKQDQMTRALQRQVQKSETENEVLKKDKSKVESELAELKAQVNTMEDEKARAVEERDLSKEQNKKLVELLQRMEKRATDKGNREEELEEQNLQLKEVTKLMTGQIEKIERELESKLIRKDDTIQELKQQLESSKQVQKYNIDLDQDLEDLAELESQFNNNSSK